MVFYCKISALNSLARHTPGFGESFSLYIKPSGSVPDYVAVCSNTAINLD